MSTEAVLTHHLEAIGAGNVDAILADYTEQSVLVTPDATLTGLGPIRALFEEFVATMLPPGSTIELTRQEIVGDYAYIVWTGEGPSLRFVLGTDTFHVLDGKIAFQTFAAQIEPK